MKKILRKIVSVIGAVVITASCIPVLAEEDTVSTEMAVYEKVIQYIQSMYIDPSLTEEDILRGGLSKLLAGNKALMEQLLKATFSSIDPYSAYYTADEASQVIGSINNIAYGVGIYVQKNIDDEYPIIAGFTNENSAAQLAGVQINDRICCVDGVDVKNMNADKVTELIVGDAGTEVTLTLMRDDMQFDITVLRAENAEVISSKTVMPMLLDANIGYIKISQFKTGTAEEFKEALELMRMGGAKKIILDLRHNGGGLVKSSVEIAKMIVPKGKIIDIEYRDPSLNSTEYSELEEKEFDFVVLVDGTTASAAEILASALQDSGAGVLVGTKTYGKAVIQDKKSFTESGDFFYLTVAQYLTRNGREINQIGLTPDKKIENYTTKPDASKYMSFDYNSNWVLGQHSDNIRAAKERLLILNYYQGKIDDEYTQDLEYAVMNFQQNSGLYPYGVIDVATQMKLDEKFRDFDTVVDNQMQTAYEMLGGSVYDFANPIF